MSRRTKVSPPLRFQSVQVVLPSQLPFEEGTSLSQEDACVRLAFQLLVERVLAKQGLANVGEGEEEFLFEV